MADKKENIKEATKPKAKKPNAKTTTPKGNDKAKENVEKITQAVVDKVDTLKQRDMNELISVICITNTPLVYVSKNQMGYRVDWDGFLDENFIEYKELINMRGAQKSFFEEPWIICDWDVLVDLKVDRYYKDIIDLENLDDIFTKSPKEIENTLKIVPSGIKKLIVDRAFELRREKKLDSLSIIEAIENTLKIDLSI